MSSNVKQHVAIACLFTWIGFVCAISFLEAWLKFQAPGMTLPIGLGIGKLVFGALNKVEWVFAIVVVACALLHGRPAFTVTNIILTLIVAILVLQTVWLLPALDARAEQYISRQPVAISNLHLWFVGAEVLKVTGLFIRAVSLFKQS